MTNWETDFYNFHISVMVSLYRIWKENNMKAVFNMDDNFLLAMTEADKFTDDELRDVLTKMYHTFHQRSIPDRDKIVQQYHQDELERHFSDSLVQIQVKSRDELIISYCNMKRLLST